MKKRIVGIVCLALLFVGCHRFDGEEIEYESTTGVQQEVQVESSQPTSPVETTKELIYVYICGAVQKSDVYALEPGARIKDAVESAGGFSPEAAKEKVNLAKLLEDGQQIYIPKVGEKEQSPEQTIAQKVEAADGGKVNINTATKEELMQLKGIGQKKAEDILNYRGANGEFQKIEDIQKVPGLKKGAFEKIKDQITVS